MKILIVGIGEEPGLYVIQNKSGKTMFFFLNNFFFARHSAGNNLQMNNDNDGLLAANQPIVSVIRADYSYFVSFCQFIKSQTTPNIYLITNIRSDERQTIFVTQRNEQQSAPRHKCPVYVY